MKKKDWEKEIRQLLCPILGTWYLVGGWEYGHQWRHIEGEYRIFCRKCFKQIDFLGYKKEEKLSKEYQDKLKSKI